jgi:hypothetical protein
MATKIKGKARIAVFAKQLIAGTDQNLGGTNQVMILGNPLTPAEIAAKLRSIVNLRADVDAARASVKAKLALEASEAETLRAFMGAYVSYVRAAYGTSPDVLATFGLSVKARARLTVEEKVGAVAKSKATRLARHTMGSRQKKAIKGDVTGVVVTPITATPPLVTTPGDPALQT